VVSLTHFNAKGRRNKVETKFFVCLFLNTEFYTEIRRQTKQKEVFIGAGRYFALGDAKEKEFSYLCKQTMTS